MLKDGQTTHFGTKCVVENVIMEYTFVWDYNENAELRICGGYYNLYQFLGRIYFYSEFMA